MIGPVVAGPVGLAGCGPVPAAPPTFRFPSTTGVLPASKLDLRPPPTAVVAVPAVTGLGYPDARQSAGNAGLPPTVVRTARRATVPAGTVVTQVPAAGAMVSSATAVTLTVSVGPPAVPGTPRCAARQLRTRPGPAVSEATGAHTLDWTLTNVSARASVVDCYPSVSLADAAGRVLPSARWPGATR